jgi:hypothetical protein
VRLVRRWVVLDGSGSGADEIDAAVGDMGSDCVAVEDVVDQFGTTPTGLPAVNVEHSLAYAQPCAAQISSSGTVTAATASRQITDQIGGYLRARSAQPATVTAGEMM